jgi:hypothetical protein
MFGFDHIGAGGCRPASVKATRGSGMIKNRFFMHNGRSLEVRAERTNGEWEIRVYDDNHPAHQIVYAVSHDRRTPGFFEEIPDQVIEQMMDVAQENIERNIVRVLPRSPAGSE